VDEHGNRCCAPIGAEVGQGVVKSPTFLKQVIADHDQLNVSGFSRGEEALVAGQLELGIISQVEEKAGKLAASVGVGVNHHCAGQLLVEHEPGECGYDTA